jgi:glyoxylase-like metal-dependent hydrolase (beta-lactamase superfamily II)
MGFALPGRPYGGVSISEPVNLYRILCELLQKELDRNGVNEDNLTLVVLTHGDCDHAGNAAYIREKYHVQIAMHPGDRKKAEEPELCEWLESFRFRSLILRLLARCMRKTIQGITQKTLDEFTSFSPDIALTDGFNLSGYGLDAEVIHVPGHTKGSIAILTSDGNLIAGDTFANMKKPGQAINAQDYRELQRSIQKLRSLAITAVYPGHGEPFGVEALYW